MAEVSERSPSLMSVATASSGRASESDEPKHFALAAMCMGRRGWTATTENNQRIVDEWCLDARTGRASGKGEQFCLNDPRVRWKRAITGRWNPATGAIRIQVTFSRDDELVETPAGTRTYSGRLRVSGHGCIEASLSREAAGSQTPTSTPGKSRKRATFFTLVADSSPPRGRATSQSGAARRRLLYDTQCMSISAGPSGSLDLGADDESKAADGAPSPRSKVPTPTPQSINVTAVMGSTGSPHARLVLENDSLQIKEYQQAERVRKLLADACRLRETLASVRGQLRDAEEKCAETSRALASTRQEAERTRQEQSRQAHAAACARSEAASLRQRLEAAQGELVEKTTRLEAAEARVDSLSGQVEQLQCSRRAGQVGSYEDGIDEEIEQMYAENTSLRERLRKTQAALEQAQKKREQEHQAK